MMVCIRRFPQDYLRFPTSADARLNRCGMLGVIFGLTLLLTSACGRSESADGDDGGMEISSVMPDTFIEDTTAEEKEADKDTIVKKNTRIRSKAEIDTFIAESPHSAEYRAGIIPTIAEYVPEYASKLLDNETDGFLIVDKNTMKLYRYDRYGRELERVGIACSKKYGTKHKKGDNRTPEGFFTIEGIYDSTDWLYTDDDGNTSPVKGQFGPRYMRLRTPVTAQVGIHGTAAPGSIGGRRSHGCIRMTNENILRIHKLCTSGMPVIVSPGPRDMAVNEEEGYNVPAVPVVKGGAPCKAQAMPKKPATISADTVPTAGPEVSAPAAPQTPAAPVPAGEESEPGSSASSGSSESFAPQTDKTVVD
ncbi:MAG: L,D-transpeptidase family protein [Muribaculaceae bacterium]|nr:L,D-transpeptidase family protein [Muribaculaceae bacterium]